MSKGKRREKAADEIYQRAGFRTFRPQESQYGETDIYGLFDLLAVPPAGSNAKVRLSQVKSNRAQGVEQWSADALQYASGTVHVEMLVCYDGQGGHNPVPPKWRLIYPGDFGAGVEHETVVDERETEHGDGDAIAAHIVNEADVIDPDTAAKIAEGLREGGVHGNE